MSSLQVLPERTNTAPLHAHLIRVQTSHEGCPWWWTFGLCVEPDDEVVFGIASFKLEHKTCWVWLPPWPDLPVLGLGWKEGLCLDERIFAISSLLHIFWGKLSCCTCLGCSTRHRPSRGRRPGCKGSWVGIQDQDWFEAVGGEKGVPDWIGKRTPWLFLVI